MLIRYMTVPGSVFAVLIAGIQFVHPAAAPESAAQAAAAIHAGGLLTPDVAGVFKRSCGDCHSEGTKWPWYSRIPPGSWLMTKHVKEGRRNLNFSEWTPAKAVSQNQVLEICDSVEKGAMPPTSYTLLHPSARLSAADVHTICGWSEQVQNGSVAATVAEFKPPSDGVPSGHNQ